MLKNKVANYVRTLYFFGKIVWSNFSCRGVVDCCPLRYAPILRQCSYRELYINSQNQIENVFWMLRCHVWEVSSIVRCCDSGLRYSLGERFVHLISMQSYLPLLRWNCPGKTESALNIVRNKISFEHCWKHRLGTPWYVVSEGSNQLIHKCAIRKEHGLWWVKGRTS